MLGFLLAISCQEFFWNCFFWQADLFPLDFLLTFFLFYGCKRICAKNVVFSSVSRSFLKGKPTDAKSFFIFRLRIFKRKRLYEFTKRFCFFSPPVFFPSVFLIAGHLMTRHARPSFIARDLINEFLFFCYFPLFFLREIRRLWNIVFTRCFTNNNFHPFTSCITILEYTLNTDVVIRRTGVFQYEPKYEEQILVVRSPR